MQNVIYKIYECNSQSQIFWHNNSENRPSPEYLNGLNWVELNGQLNWLDFFNLNINIKNGEQFNNTTFGYYKVERWNSGGDSLLNTSYYYCIGINKENIDSITISLTLDLWSTYSINILNKNVVVESLRNHVNNSNAYQLTDSLLDQVPIVYDNDSFKVISGEYKHQVVGSTDWYIIPSQPYLNYSVDIRLGFYQGTAANNIALPTNVYYIFKDLPNIDKFHYHAFPAWFDKSSDPSRPYERPNIRITKIGSEEIIKEYYVDNNIDDLNALLTNTELAPFFVGIYVLPNVCALKTFNDPVRSYGGKNFFTVTLPIGSYPNRINTNDYPIIQLPWSGNEILKYNSTDINNKILYKFFDIKYNNLSQNANLINKIENGRIGFGAGQLYFMFNGCGTLFPLIKNLNNESCVWTYPYQLPAVTDQYANYIASIQSQMNTGLTQANDSFKLGISQSIVGGLFSTGGAVAGSAIKGDIAGAITGTISGLTNTAFAAGNKAMNYEHYKQGVSAKLEDIKRTTGNQMIASSTRDLTSIITSRETNYGPLFNIKMREITTYLQPNDQTLKNLNNILFLFGNVNPTVAPINDLMPRPKFNYLLLSDKWIGTYIDILFAHEPVDVKQAIKDNIAGGFRVWKVEPDLNVEN